MQRLKRWLSFDDGLSVIPNVDCATRAAGAARSATTQSFYISKQTQKYCTIILARGGVLPKIKIQRIDVYIHKIDTE